MRDSDVFSIASFERSSTSQNSRIKEHRILDVGVRVRVSRGTLSGLTGEVIDTIKDGHFVKCVVAVDGWPDGAFLLLASDALE